MLGKLIKHEWKAVWKLLTILNVFLVCLTIIGSTTISYLVRHNTETIPAVMQVVLTLGVIFYIVTIIVVSCTTVIFLALRFYRNMYSSEGYLTHTLPVTPMQHIVSKGIVSTIWYFISSLNVVISVFALILPTGGNSAADIWNGIREFFPALDTALRTYLHLSLPVFLLIMLLFLLVCLISSISMIYASISIGQLFHKHRVISSIAVYFGFTMLIQVFASIISAAALSHAASDVSAYTSGTEYMYSAAPHAASAGVYVSEADMNLFTGFTVQAFWTAFLLCAVTGIVFTAITYYTTKKKLNLE